LSAACKGCGESLAPGIKFCSGCGCGSSVEVEASSAVLKSNNAQCAFDSLNTEPPINHSLRAFHISIAVKSQFIDRSSVKVNNKQLSSSRHNKYQEYLTVHSSQFSVVNIFAFYYFLFSRIFLL
jgi:hypothetical protein